MTKILRLYFHNKEGRLACFDIGISQDDSEFYFVFAVEKE